MTPWPTSIQDRVLALHDAGYHLIPMIETGKGKTPAVKWKPYQTKQPDLEVTQQWLNEGYEIWALLGGTEKQLVCLDFESTEIEAFAEIIAHRPPEAVVTSPSGGTHVWVEMADAPAYRSHQLAHRFLGTWKVVNGVETDIPDTNLLAEIRGDGGYAVLISPGRAAHPEWSPVVMTEAELDAVILEIARVGDDMEKIKTERRGDRPPKDAFHIEGSTALYRAEQDQARFFISVLQYPQDLDWSVSEVWDTGYYRRQEWRARCPVHTANAADHSSTSLSWGIRVDSGKPRFVWHCHANCPNDEIATVLDFGLAPDRENVFEDDVEERVYRLQVEAAAKDIVRNGISRTVLPTLQILGDIEEVPIEWRFAPASTDVTGLLPVAGNMLLVAERKAGKSSIALQLAAGCTNGGTVLGAWTCKPLARDEKVCVLNYEVSESQAARWAKETGCDLERTLMINARGKRNPLLAEKDRADLADALRIHNVKVLVVDPLGRALAAGEGAENDAGAINEFFGMVEQVADMAGISELIVVAHAGKKDFKARGSSAIEGWPDSLVYIRRDENTDERYLKADGRDVAVAEARIDWDPIARCSTYVFSDKPKKASATKADEHRERIKMGMRLAMTSAPDGISIAGLCKALRAQDPPLTPSENTVSKYLTEDDNFVKHQMKWFTWKQALTLGYVEDDDSLDLSGLDDTGDDDGDDGDDGDDEPEKPEWS